MTPCVRVGLALAVALASASPALAVAVDGYQTIVDFEEFAPGAGDLYYAGLDTYILGGTVTAGGGFTPKSGTNVYVGTSISTRQTAGDFNFSGVDYWPYLGAYISPGGATVFVTFYGYDPGDNAQHVIGTAQTSGNAASQFISLTDLAGQPPWLLSMAFTSDQAFAVDDILLGLPDVAPGVPEPQGWALMLLGFVGAGSAIRRRRRQAATFSGA